MRKKQVVRGFILYGAVFCMVFLVSPRMAMSAFEPSVSVNAGADETSERRVSISIVGPRDAEHIRISNSLNDITNVEWSIVRDEWNAWWLPDGSGWKTVYVQFRLRNGSETRVYNDKIYLRLRESGGGSVQINDNDQYTESKNVTLSITVPDDATRMRIANHDHLGDVDWRSVAKSTRWTLDDGVGRRMVRLQFKDKNDKLSNIYTDEIIVVKPAEVVISVSVNNGKKETTSQNVILALNYSSDVRRVRVSNTASFADSSWQPVRTLVPWVLTAGSGMKKIFIEFEDVNEKKHKKELTIKYSEPVNPGYIQPIVVSSDAGAVGNFTQGNVVKGSQKTLYYVGSDGAIYPFTNVAVFFSWYNTFHQIKMVSDGELARRVTGRPMCVRPGTHLVKFRGGDRVYAVEPACRLRPLMSEVEAFIIYGRDWGRRVIDLPVDEKINYTVLPIGGYAVVGGDVDSDLDGVADSVELVFGSDKTSADTDDDKLSDYEEIFYWFTDPRNPDTNADGTRDGNSVLLGISPTDGKKISVVPENSYTYPRGSLIAIYPNDNNRSKFYYRSYDGLIYSVGSRDSEDRFTKNKFQKRFGVTSGLEIIFSKWVQSISVDNKRVYEPVSSIDSLEYRVL
jgi:hypothetical protein